MRFKFQNMLYKKISTFFQEDSVASRKDKKKNEKGGENLNQDSMENKCRSKLHKKFTQKMLQIIMMQEEINNTKTLKLISLLP